jgi:hypothetical protein
LQSYFLPVENFEWHDGNPGGEDRVGHFIMLAPTSNKITFATGASRCIGVTIPPPEEIEEEWFGKYERDGFGRIKKRLTFLPAFLELANRYHISFGREIISSLDTVSAATQIRDLLDSHRDDYQGIENYQSFYEEIPNLTPEGVPIISAAYDVSRPYVRRKDRQEWAWALLVGKARVIEKSSGACRVFGKCGCDGGLATVGSSWLVIERNSERIITIMFYPS